MSVHVCQITSARINYRGREGEHVLDTTVKSARGIARTFAPTWEMVMGHKQHRILWSEYTEAYYALMRKRFQVNEEHFKELLYADRIVLCCYCPDTSRNIRRCHRYLLADILMKLGPRYSIDAVQLGELHH